MTGRSAVRNTVPARVLTPGAKFRGLLIFEMPATAPPVSVVLHDAALGKGVLIPPRRADRLLRKRALPRCAVQLADAAAVPAAQVR